MEGKGKSYHYDKVQQVAEPLPVHDEPDFDGWSVLITSISGLIMAVATLVGAVKGKRYVEKKREVDPNYMRIRKGK
jgi:hypothetical protein